MTLFGSRRRRQRQAGFVLLPDFLPPRAKRLSYNRMSCEAISKAWSLPVCRPRTKNRLVLLAIANATGSDGVFSIHLQEAAEWCGISKGDFIKHCFNLLDYISFDYRSDFEGNLGPRSTGVFKPIATIHER